MDTMNMDMDRNLDNDKGYYDIGWYCYCGASEGSMRWMVDGGGGVLPSLPAKYPCNACEVPATDDH